MNNEKGPKLAAVARCQDKKSSLFHKYDFAKWILYDVWRLDKRVRLCCVSSCTRYFIRTWVCARAATLACAFVHVLLPSHVGLCTRSFLSMRVFACNTSFTCAFVHVLPPSHVHSCTHYLLRTCVHARATSFIRAYACACACLFGPELAFVCICTPGCDSTLSVLCPHVSL